MKHLRKRLTYANIMSSIAVFLVVGGGAAFAALGKNTVGTKQLKRNAVKVGKIGPEAVKAGKLAKNAVATNRLRDSAVTSEKIANLAVTSGKLGDASVLTDKLADESVTSGKLAKDSVLTDKLADESVTSGKLAKDSVLTDKLANNAVTSAKILNGQVRAGDLGAIIQVQNTVNVPNNENGNAVVACPAGSVVISGGGFTGSFTNMDLVTTIREGNGWRIEARNTTGSEKPLTVRAYCLQG